MTLRQKIISFTALTIISCIIPQAFAAFYPGTDLIRLEFEMTGEPLIYSNYPETIYVEGLTQSGVQMDPRLCINQLGVVNGVDYGIGRHFNKVEIEPGRNYTAEIYNGRTSSDLTSYTFGIAFINESASEANVNILQSGQQESDLAGIVMMALDTHKRYIHSSIGGVPENKNSLLSYPRTVSLKPREGKVVLFGKVNRINGYVNGRIRFNADGDVTILEFYMLTDTLETELNNAGLSMTQDNLDSCNLYSVLCEIANDDRRVIKLEDFPRIWTTTTAILNYDTRVATVDAPVGTKFCLSNAGHIKGIRDLNTNEYEPLKENDYGGFPVGDNRIHDGNYSIIYDLTLNQAAGKNVLITPYKEAGRSTSSGALLYNTQYGWQMATPNADTWVFPIAKDGKFKFVLPGSVYGDVLFEIIEPDKSDGHRLAWLDGTCAPWAIETVSSAITAGIVPTDLHTQYESMMTRQEFCRLAVNIYLVHKGETLAQALENAKVSDLQEVFKDTDDGAVLLAHRLGVVGGIGNGFFAPERTITREEAAAMMARMCTAVGFNGGDPSLAASYADDTDISGWARENVYALTNVGLFVGTGSGMFSPKSALMRQEGIVLMYRLYNLL